VPFFGRKPEVHGSIEYLGLTGWWLKEFSSAERESMAIIAPTLVEGKIDWTSATAAMTLNGLSSYLYKTPADRKLALRLLAKAAECAITSKEWEDLHFAYQSMITVYYRDRETDPAALPAAIQACEQQIPIASKVRAVMERRYPESPLPGHAGYNQLRIIRKKQGDLAAAIRVCEQAAAQGWNNRGADWAARYKAKIKNAG